MEESQLDSWLTLYKKAWTSRDSSIIPQLFSEDATYQEKPFDAKISGLESIIQYWNKISSEQEDIKFSYTLLATTKDYGLAHWNASFLRNSDAKFVKLDGIFLVYLDKDNRCTRFQEWWQSYKTYTN